jgi:aldehyde dehydrogenase (NAD+)
MNTDINLIFEHLKSNTQSVKNTTVSERRAKLKKLLIAINAYQSEIESAIHNDFKKSKFESTLTEIYPVVSQIKHVMDHLSDWMQPTTVDAPLTYFGTRSYVHYEPKGVCLIISPWNFPFLLAFSPLIHAIGAGNVAIVKPSEFTPHTSAIILKIISEVFNSNEVTVLEGDHTLAGELLKLPFDHIFFTGSPAIGKIVMKAASENLTSVTLELGGKSPVVIDNTADVRDAAKKVAWASLINNGQTCIEPDYILVDQKIEASFTKSLQENIELLYGKDIKSNTDYCRIVNRKHFDRIKSIYEDAIANGAKVVFGGDMDESQNYIAPTILTNVSPNMRIMQEEIFGPLMPIIPFTNLEEAIKLINQKDKPLANYIFSKSQKNIDYFISNTTAGGTNINDLMLHITQPNLPFGGVNNSGIGRTHGRYGFIEFSNQRSILRQHSPIPVNSFLYPPYHLKWKVTLLKWTLKYF